MRIYMPSIEYEVRCPTVRNYVNSNFRDPDEVAIVKIDECPDYDYVLMRCSVSTKSDEIITREVGKVRIVEGV